MTKRILTPAVIAIRNELRTKLRLPLVDSTADDVEDLINAEFYLDKGMSREELRPYIARYRLLGVTVKYWDKSE